MRQRPDCGDTSRLRVLVRKVGVGRERQVVAAVFLLAAADHHRAEGFGRRQHLSGVCHDDRAVTLPCGHEGGRETEADLRVCGLLCGLGFEGGDFRGSNGTRPWPSCASHDQTAHA